MSNAKVMIIHLIVRLIKTTLHKMSQHFPKPYRNLGGDIKIELNFSIYTTKSDWRNATRVDASKLAAKHDWQIEDCYFWFK